MIDAGLAADLQRVATAPFLLVASDFDGTLSPIVSDPARATPHRAALAALVQLAALPAVHAAIISGRSVAALADLTGAPSGVTLIGTHGVESSEATTGASAARPPQRREALRRILARAQACGRRPPLSERGRSRWRCQGGASRW